MILFDQQDKILNVRTGITIEKMKYGSKKMEEKKNTFFKLLIFFIVSTEEMAFLSIRALPTSLSVA